MHAKTGLGIRRLEPVHRFLLRTAIPRRRARSRAGEPRLRPSPVGSIQRCANVRTARIEKPSRRLQPARTTDSSPQRACSGVTILVGAVTMITEKPMQSVPITILAGSDLRAAAAQGPTAGLHPLAAYKGAAIRVGDRPIVAVLCERLQRTPGFGPIRIAGPRAVYETVHEMDELIDTDGSVGENLRAAIEHHERCSGDRPMGLMATDVLAPTEGLLELREQFENSRPCALFFPLVRRPHDKSALAEFAWKPSYAIRPDCDSPAVPVLPGHLGFVDPGALRLPLLYRLIDGAYSARNRSIASKRRALIANVVLGLLGTDARLMLRLRAPTRTLTALTRGLGIARKLRTRSLRLEELESAIGHIVVRRSYRRGTVTRAIRLPLVDDLWLAEDVDTAEEQRALESQAN